MYIIYIYVFQCVYISVYISVIVFIYLCIYIYNCIHIISMLTCINSLLFVHGHMSETEKPNWIPLWFSNEDDSSLWWYTFFPFDFQLLSTFSTFHQSANFSQTVMWLISFPKWKTYKVIKMFQHYFMLNNLNFISSIIKCFQQFSFWFKQFCLLLLNNCKWFHFLQNN